MDYKTHYHNLIERARCRILDGYKERHHIVPRCLGGNDSQENLVELTAREHYIAHQLLVKMHPDNASLLYAARMMTVDSPTHKRSKNRLYEWLKRKNLPIHTGEKNSQFGTCWITNVQQRVCKKISKLDLAEYLLEGWKEGRIQRFDLTSAEQSAIVAINNGTSKYKAFKDNGLSYDRAAYRRFEILFG